ncbi:MAG: RtcB family protein [Cytophagaceae bacterium]|nr:MAG: RtcB family protein [Cytophagaceae bacterium]
MHRVNTSQRWPLKIWASLLEPQAEEQALNLAKLPFIHKHVALMPDAHAGKGSTIGSVIATRGAIMPSCCGIDLGCGMSAVWLRRPIDDFGGTARLRELRNNIEQVVPVGQSSRQTPTLRGIKLFYEAQARDIEERVQKRLAIQCGTLGGGNHFIELCADERGQAWVMLHSGSRYVGKYLAEKHINTAKGLMRSYFVELPDPDLAYLAESTPEFEAYISDMLWAQEYARKNRADMLEQVLKECAKHLPANYAELASGEIIDCHHNYTTREHHYGANVWVTRKGAVCARKGIKGIIPGSMGARSFIVEGLGNPESFDSCAHGAGRAMSRTQAKATYTVDDLIAQTAGVECSHRRSVVDEIPAAYKPIDVVMRDQVDLVRPLHTLKQVLCVKG